MVLVLTDRGLWSPHLWKGTGLLGWHPLMRVKHNTSLQPLGGRRQPARLLIPGPNHAWVRTVIAFSDPRGWRFGTLLVGLASLNGIGVLGPQGSGWQWQHTQRTGPDRVARHWLVLAVAMVWVAAYGTGAEGAEAQGLPPGRLAQRPSNPFTIGSEESTSSVRLLYQFALITPHN
jgi:hypothetical protein